MKTETHEKRIRRLERKIKRIENDLEVNLRWKQEDMKDLDKIKKKLKIK